MIELNISFVSFNCAFVFLTWFEFIYLINCLNLLINCKVVLIYMLVGYGNRG